MSRDYDFYIRTMQEIADIGHATAVLHWDKEVYMPPGSSAFRSRQIATLSGLAHSKFIDEKFGLLLEDLSKNQSLDDDQKRNVDLTLKDYRKAVKLAPEFVQRVTHASAEAFQKWIEARKANKFEVFLPALTELVELKREEAELRGYAEKPYDALLDLYEPELTTSLLNKVFSEAKTGIYSLLQKLKTDAGIDDGFLRTQFDTDKQWQFGEDLLKSMHYDFDHGRQDLSEHPFTISFSPQDVRITTRINDSDLGYMTWSSIHELGHAHYEHGLPGSQYGLPLGQAASLSVHESQSRLWENHVGRSREFCNFLMPKLQQYFPDQFNNVSGPQFYQAINKITPNLIRTESDELHYHLQVIIRFELEDELINQNMPVEDLRDAWNDKYQKYLGLAVLDDNQGVLQDVHWSHGSFGYFPTYSLGSFYAAQIFKTAEVAIPGLKDQIQSGKFDVLLHWLREEIHQHGRKYDPEDLCQKVSGEPLNIKHFMEYANAKYMAIYTVP